MTSTQYDDIGDRYSSVKQLPASTLELAAVREQIGNINGLQVLDLACGNGFYSRKLIEWGAQKVFGVDISQAMVDDAHVLAGGDDRMDFLVGDCTKPLNIRRFDIVLAVYFLNYAANEEQLLAMWRNVSDSLKPGGQCIGIVPNLDMLHKIPFPDQPLFGLSVKVLEKVKDGVKFQVLFNISEPFTIYGYMLSQELYEKCAKEVGMEIQWMSPTDPKVPDIDFDDCLRCPHFKVFRASRFVK